MTALLLRRRKARAPTGGPPPPPPPPPPPSGEYTFQSSGIVGGGFQNVFAISPFLDGAVRPYLIGADVAGVHRSENGALTWTPANVGGLGSHVATLLWSDLTAGKCYAGTDSGFYVSTDWGKSWTKKAGTTSFDANGTYYVSGEHPRPTGNLIAQDTSGATKYIWVATHDQGLKRSTDDGATYPTTALTADYLRSVAVNPLNKDEVFVAVRNGGTYLGGGPALGDATRNGIWRSTDARGAMGFTKMTAYPGTKPEEIYALDDNGTFRLFVADDDAVYQYTGGTWSNITPPTLDAGAHPQSITAYRGPGGGLVILVGASSPVGDRAIWRTIDGGTNWASITSGGSVVVDWNVNGTSNRSWLADITYHRFAGPNWVPSHIVSDPDDRDRILVAGRGGCWLGTLSGGIWTWRPAFAGLMVTVNMAIATPHTGNGRVVVGNMDYTLLESSDQLTNVLVSGAQWDAGAPTTGDTVCFDPEGAAPFGCYLGASKRGNPTQDATNDVYFNPDTFGNGSWSRLNVPSDGDCTALGVGKDGSNARVVLVGVTNGGFWRKVGAGAWTQLTGTAPFLTGGGNGYIRFRRGTTVVYAIDGTGVWRSNSAGAQASWTKILDANATYGDHDALALDPIDPAVLYVRTGGALKRLTNASTSTSVANTTSSNLIGADVGPICISQTGDLFAHKRDGSLMRSTNPRAAATFTDISDAFYKANSKNIRSLQIGPDDVLYTAENGSGTIVGAKQVPVFKVSGANWQLNGTNFVPVGFVMMVVALPIGASCAEDGPSNAAWSNWQTEKTPMLTALRDNWKCDTFRLQLGQAGIDPQGKWYSQAYVDRIKTVVDELRAWGFVTILSLQDWDPICGDLHKLPTQHTIRAWQKLAPVFKGDSGVAFEIFNEPWLNTSFANPTTDSWNQWRNGGHTGSGVISQANNAGDAAVGHQQVLEAIRGTGATNVVIAEGTKRGHRLDGIPLLTDTLSPPNVGYAIHTAESFHIAGNTPTQNETQVWEPHFGFFKAQHNLPVIATEWELRRVASLAGVRDTVEPYLDWHKAKGYGITPWAIDVGVGPFHYVLSRTGANAWVPNDWDAWVSPGDTPGTGAGELLYARYPTW